MLKDPELTFDRVTGIPGPQSSHADPAFGPAVKIAVCPISVSWTRLLVLIWGLFIRAEGTRSANWSDSHHHAGNTTDVSFPLIAKPAASLTGFHTGPFGRS